MRNNFLLWVILLSVNTVALASSPGEKRTILTAGDKVHPIRFQLGQSTILYLGFKPDTVICGNKNYFNIEKIKEGITIQPLMNFATNLTVLSGNRRFLFYLIPALGFKSDAFVDVKWVSSDEVLPIDKIKSTSSIKIIELNQKLKIENDIEITVLRVKAINNSKRRILEINLKNDSNHRLKTAELKIFASSKNYVFLNQVTAWEADEVAPQSSLRGRVILNDAKFSSLDLVIRFRNKETRIAIRGFNN